MIIIPLTDDKYDIGGTKIDDKGRVHCKKYSNDDFILTGIFGIKVTTDSVALPFPSKKFAVATDAMGLRSLDEKNNYVKFQEGDIVHLGDMDSCLNFIKSKQ